MVHLIIGIKVTYLDKRSFVLAAEIIVKATLAIISALQDCTIQHYFFHWRISRHSTNLLMSEIENALTNSTT